MNIEDIKRKPLKIVNGLSQLQRAVPIAIATVTPIKISNRTHYCICNPVDASEPGDIGVLVEESRFIYYFVVLEDKELIFDAEFTAYDLGFPKIGQHAYFIPCRSYYGKKREMSRLDTNTVINEVKQWLENQ